MFFDHNNHSPTALLRAEKEDSSMEKALETTIARVAEYRVFRSEIRMFDTWMVIGCLMAWASGFLAVKVSNDFGFTGIPALLLILRSWASLGEKFGVLRNVVQNLRVAGLGDVMPYDWPNNKLTSLPRKIFDYLFFGTGMVASVVSIYLFLF